MATREFAAVTDLPHKSPQVALIKKGPRLPVIVTPPGRPGEHRGEALVDTGASASAVALEVVHDLGLRKVGETDIFTQAGPIGMGLYAVDIYVEDLGRMRTHAALGSPWIGKLGLVALLGRDVLQDAVFTYEGINGRFRISFPRG